MQLTCAAAASVDMFITNDQRLSRHVVLVFTSSNRWRRLLSDQRALGGVNAFRRDIDLMVVAHLLDYATLPVHQQAHGVSGAGPYVSSAAGAVARVGDGPPTAQPCGTRGLHGGRRSIVGGVADLCGGVA